MSEYKRDLSESRRCRGCGQYGITWAEQRRQYGRLLRRGISPEAVKGLLPRCQKCVTALLHHQKCEFSADPRRTPINRALPEQALDRAPPRQLKEAV
jgi:hypothetical protein